MSYKICPKIQYQYDCKSLVVYNDFFSDLCAEEGDPADTISALSFRLRRYNETEYLRTRLLSKAGKDAKKIILEMKNSNAHSVLDNIKF